MDIRSGSSCKCGFFVKMRGTLIVFLLPIALSNGMLRRNGSLDAKISLPLNLEDGFDLFGVDNPGFLSRTILQVNDPEALESSSHPELFDELYPVANSSNYRKRDRMPRSSDLLETLTGSLAHLKPAANKTRGSKATSVLSAKIKRPNSDSSYNYAAAALLAGCVYSGKGCTCRDWVGFVRNGYAREASRVCDGFCDCPECEDETGCAIEMRYDTALLSTTCVSSNCHMCPKGYWSCAEDGLADPGCYTKEQECDDVLQCGISRRDERACWKLDHPWLKPQMSLPVLPRGLVHRKIAGRWLLVCASVYVTDVFLAQTICKRTVGPIEQRPTQITNVKVISRPGLTYAFWSESGDWTEVKECSHSHIHIVCPEPRCGSTRHDPDRSKRSVGKASLASGGYGGAVGGATSTEDQFPWHVLLRITVAGESIRGTCSGTIVAPQWILSAAHCFVLQNLGRIQPKFEELHYVAMAGMMRMSSASPYTQIRHGVKVVVHEKYSGLSAPSDGKHGYLNDIALMKVRSPFLFNLHVNALCLPSPDAKAPPGLPCLSAGWGTSLQGRKPVDHMLESVVPVWEQCPARKSEAQVCAGRKQGGMENCGGDLGGPLVCRFEGVPEIQGIRSHGFGCGERNNPGVYTKVSKFVPWIRSIVDEQSYETDKLLENRLGPCHGMTCDDGRCLVPKEICNGVIDCPAHGKDESVQACRRKKSVSGHLAPKRDVALPPYFENV